MKIRMRDGRPIPSHQESTVEPGTPRQIIGRLLETTSPASAIEENGQRHAESAPVKPPIAIFCYDSPDGFVGRHVRNVVSTLAQRGRTVHLFCRAPFVIEAANVRLHVVGNGEESDLIEQVQQFGRKAGNAFLQVFPNGDPVAVIGYEWSSAPVLALLKGLRNQSSLLSLHSIEAQRSDLSNAMSQQIAEIEQEGMQAATSLLIHDPKTLEAIRSRQLASEDRLVSARQLFSSDPFDRPLDAGEIKARYQVGPIDPTILFIGDLDERYGPDLALRAMPAILRHHPQARLVIVGDGNMFWPLRVYARYLLLEHAVRLIGHLEEQPLLDLIQASDLLIVPSRESTPWWPIQIGWAAGKPVVATHESARGLTEHEKDSVLVYPSENSIVWGVERVLYDEELRRNIAQAGQQKLETRFGWNGLTEQIEELLAVTAVR